MTATSNQVARLQFFLPREPFPGQRTKCACRGKFPTIYNPSEYTDWKKQAAEYIADAIPPSTRLEAFKTSAVRLSAEFVATPPKTTKLARPKPDIDNYLKAIMDAITQSEAVWGDDTQVAELGRVRKRWATPGEPPGTYVTIEFEVQ
jgi:Holliday junction resolvase RusA-like endonuclease